MVFWIGFLIGAGVGGAVGFLVGWAFERSAPMRWAKSKPRRRI